MRTRGTALIATLAAVALGCGSDESANESQSPRAKATSTAAAGAQLPQALQGVFGRELTRRDKKAAGASLGGPPNGLPLGRLKLSVESDGVVFAIHSDTGDEELRFEQTLDRIKVTGGEYCADPAASATYRWSRSGDALTIEPIDNDCPDRQAVLAGTWRSE